MRGRAVLAVVRSVARRPGLWPTAARVAVRTARRGWWRRPPFLPVPGEGYVRFRLLTQYGAPRATPEPADVIRYLEWCRDWPAGW